MTSPVPFATAALVLLLAGGASAQTTVYETRDAEGNVTFSDESSPDSRTVEIQRTDVVEAPQPMPSDSEEVTEEEPSEGNDGRAAPGEREVIYGDGDPYLYDDPRLRREAVREGVDGDPGAIAGDDESLRQAERREAARFDERNSGDPIENADRAAERSDITGPNAEYRNAEPPVPHEGGRR